jgi:hypothetical protein
MYIIAIFINIYPPDWERIVSPLSLMITQQPRRIHGESRRDMAANFTMLLADNGSRKKRENGGVWQLVGVVIKISQ